MKIGKENLKAVIKRLLEGKDYREVVIDLINIDFLDFTIDFFKKVASAKFDNEKITNDWYRKEFLNDNLPADEIAINSGLNKKTIHNIHNTSTKDIVIEASNEHYDSLYEMIQKLVIKEDEIDIRLTIKFNSVSVELTVSESLIVINTLAVKRAALRGGSWSAIGKGVEGPLMVTLCKLYNVPAEYFSAKAKNKPVVVKNFEREIDFYLYDGKNKEQKCEVKLMGRGNPESADAVIARDSKVFIADKLSDTNKKQLNSLNIHWVELRGGVGLKKFGEILKELQIPYKALPNKLDSEINKILDEILL